VKNTNAFWFGLSIFISILLLLGYGLVYQLQPFPSFWNDFWLNTTTVIASIFTAVTALMVMFCYDRQDGGFRVWLYFSLGFILWALAEISWSASNLIFGETPTPSLPDYLWIAGYVFFGLGFLRQYRILYGSSRGREQIIFAAIWIAAFIVTRIVQVLFGEPASIGNFIDLFYPVADLAVCAVALGIVWTFRRGVMARPWLALFVFGLADGLYAWLFQTGTYAWSVENGNPLSLIADESYAAAYLIIGLGFLLQYFLLRYGPWAFGQKRKQEIS
jgi:hypothetical protein